VIVEVLLRADALSIGCGPGGNKRDEEPESLITSQDLHTDSSLGNAPNCSPE
jgi:hypothetical protein